MNKTSESGSHGASTLRRGLHILAALRRAPEGLDVPGIARALDMQRTSVYRYITVLVEEGYAVRDQQSGLYRAAANESQVVGDQGLSVARLAPAMRRISDQTGDSSFLICRVGSDSLCLHREIGSYPVQVLAVTVGHRQPLGVGAAGLALLAALPSDEANALIEQNAASLRSYGHMTASHMRLLVQATRDRGWSAVGNAAVSGVLGVGVALLDRSGYPRVAVSVSCILDRMPSARQRTIAELIRREVGSVA
ncbi:IclR family transcriptional regulator [Bordetella sp. 15P40C-2]|uniref:IclR family transcriptional regulator n=1 Tax=Bordetella sp. 15P40C-2 TaxID=2572246 RepID=UPI00132913F1|nr:IclR family transcriptional regulator C-terminal domain-containing protein [Bordetella sp. 15P40C-2]MVW73531.1 helix-turn-helix domain-containing protein [Bordetella sp. 15P40C-2]